MMFYIYLNTKLTMNINVHYINTFYKLLKDNIFLKRIILVLPYPVMIKTYCSLFMLIQQVG